MTLQEVIARLPRCYYLRINACSYEVSVDLVGPEGVVRRYVEPTLDDVAPHLADALYDIEFAQWRQKHGITHVHEGIRIAFEASREETTP